MKLPKFTGLSHVCIIVDDVIEAMEYYAKLLGAVPFQHIPRWHNEGFFKAAGFIKEAHNAEVSIAYMLVPGTHLALELMHYHSPKGRTVPIVFGPNDVSGARHIALKVANIEEAYEYIRHQSDVTPINADDEYGIFSVDSVSPEELYFYDKEREEDVEGKKAEAEMLGRIKYFDFIDRYGLQWEFEQGHTDIGD